MTLLSGHRVLAMNDMAGRPLARYLASLGAEIVAGDLDALAGASFLIESEGLARLGHEHAGLAAGQFISPHGLAVDSRGDIYVGEVSYTNWGRRVRAKGEESPTGLRSLQKLVKVG